MPVGVLPERSTVRDCSQRRPLGRGPEEGLRTSNRLVQQAKSVILSRNLVDEKSR